MKKTILLLPAVAMLMTGCGSMLSVSPLATSENVIQDPRLIGAWQDEKGENIVVVRPSEDKAYEVLYVSAQDSAVALKFEVQLVQLKESRFLDMVRRTDGWSIPGHNFAKISLDGDTAKISFLDSDWLKEQILAERPATRYKQELLILRDNPAGLQEMVGKYANEPRAFDGELNLKRIYK